MVYLSLPHLKDNHNGTVKTMCFDFYSPVHLNLASFRSHFKPKNITNAKSYHGSDLQCE